MKQAKANWFGTTLIAFVVIVWASVSFAQPAPKCDKPLPEQGKNFVWTHAFYHDKHGNILHIEELQPQQNMANRKLRAIGNRDIPVCTPGAFDYYFCPASSTVAAIDSDATIAIYYARREDLTQVAAYCFERLKNVNRRIKCAANDPTEDDGQGACTFCYCGTRPCPPTCCQ